MRRAAGRVPASCAALAALLAAGCGREETIAPPDDEDGIRTIPVVVHVVHLGEPEGEGHNLSTARIHRQIEILNEDYRRKPGTRGFNEHPDGADTRIEFVLATMAPDGSPATGITRTDANATENPSPPNGLFDYYSHYGYWDPERYLNVWTMPLPEETRDLILGMATGPDTDLPGAALLERGEPYQSEGVLINAVHFGETGEGGYGLGRTLTHEVGHYLGLLHTWGGGNCEENDFCTDTPPVSQPVTACAPTVSGCDGTFAQVENFMNYTPDACMNLFTREQVARMHHVLTHTTRRKLLEGLPKAPL